jgi:hypothetical protein
MVRCRVLLLDRGLDKRPQTPYGGAVTPHSVAVDPQGKPRVGMPELVHNAAWIDS